MLDIKFVRENPEVVKQNIRNKFQDNKLELVDKVLELDKENREQQLRRHIKNRSASVQDEVKLLKIIRTLQNRSYRG